MPSPHVGDCMQASSIIMSLYSRRMVYSIKSQSKGGTELGNLL